MTVCEAVVRPHEFDYAKWEGNGRHPASRLKIFKAFLLKAYFYIQDEAPRRDVPVEDVVKVMRCSRRYAELIFRDQLGITIKDEIDRVRLNHVKELLRRTNKTPVEIASQCRFPSDVALYAQFYRKFGLSMRKFRKQIGSLA